MQPWARSPSMSEKSFVEVAPSRNRAKIPPIAHASPQSTEATNDHPATFSRPPRVTAIVKFAANQWRLVRPKAGKEYTNVASAPTQ